MRMRRVAILIAGLLMVLGVCPTKSHAVTRISADISFYDDLSPYGSWAHVSRYGDCWVPRHRYASWRPYTVGYWVDTDYGWMWVSEDPWGDIPYHYGRWAYDPYYGWVWVPDDDLVWAPAWVSWRSNDDYVGWAPLPPDAGWGGSGLTINVTILDRRIDRSGWCFAPVRAFGSTRVRYDILPPSRNVTLISQTRNMTRYETYNSYPVNRGPAREVIQRAIGRPIPRYQVTDRQGNLRKATVQGRTIEVYRPRITGVRRERQRFAPLGQGAPPRDATGRQRVQQGREDVRTRQERGATDRQRVQDRARENEVRRQQQSEMRMQQQRDAQRRQEQGQRQRQRGQGGDQGQGQDQRDRGQGGPPPDRGQGGRGRGQDQGGRGQGQDQGGKGKGQGQDQGGKGQDKGGKNQDQGQDQGQDQNQNDQNKNRGRGHGG